MLTLLTYCLVGAIVGVLAGLLGVGGGGVIVPILVYLLPQHDVPPDIIMHLALGTSLACIIFSSISSLRAHHRRGAVNWGGGFKDNRRDSHRDPDWIVICVDIVD